MKKLLALLDSALSNLRDSRISARPADRISLAPVWVMPIAGPSERA